MTRKPRLSKFPEPERQQLLGEYLAVLDQHPELIHFRILVRSRPDRQLALFAALEREVVVGSPSATPPKPDDQADIFLCDILDCVDRHPRLKDRGSAYGPHRHLATLQTLGLWRGNEPLSTPTARELFATTFSRLTTEPATDLPPSGTNYSPASQEFGPGGELIDASSDSQTPSHHSSPSPQTMDGVLVVSNVQGPATVLDSPDPQGITRHEAQTPGEQFDAGLTDSRTIPARPIRRGRPAKLDDMAKGRLLGLMSYGLSFRQAAAQLGVHHQTLLNLMKRDEEFAQQVSEARLDAISQPLLAVVHASRTNWRAAAWLAKFLEDRRLRNLETTPEERELERSKRS